MGDDQATKNYNIKGILKWGKTPLSGVRVTMNLDETKTVLTNDNGEFHFKYLKPQRAYSFFVTGETITEWYNALDDEKKKQFPKPFTTQDPTADDDKKTTVDTVVFVNGRYRSPSEFVGVKTIDISKYSPAEKAALALTMGELAGATTNSALVGVGSALVVKSELDESNKTTTIDILSPRDPVVIEITQAWTAADQLARNAEPKRNLIILVSVIGGAVLFVAILWIIVYFKNK